jgi:hypothetical protein
MPLSIVKFMQLRQSNFWKLMLQQLNAAYDRNTINLLLMVATLEEAKSISYEVTGDGLQAFSPLLASGLIKVNVFVRPAMNRSLPYYEIKLSEKGRSTMKAWKDGDPHALP